MVAVIARRFGTTALRLVGLCALLGALAGAMLSLAPAAADGHNNPALVISIIEDSDNVVAPGSTFEVRAQLRYSGSIEPSGAEILAGSRLRLSGALDWDARGIGAAYTIPAGLFSTGLFSSGLFSSVAGTTLIPMDGAAAYDATAGAAGSGVWPVAWDSRTLVAYAGTTNGSLLVFDANADPPKQVLKIDGAANERLGAASGTNAKITSRPVAVWDENDTTAWIFAGAPNASTNVGKLYIYKISYAANGTATSTQITTPLAPPMTEYTNRVVAADVPYYGRAVSISADGQTLAVSAPDMNSVGAVYVYTKPAGGWNSLTYNDGIKVTPAQIPAWGTIGDATTRPFDQTSTNTGDAYNQCDSYCSKVNANTDSLFGWSIELSGDGSTLAVGATEKDYPDSTAGGSFTSGPTDAGAVLIFNAPTGGWSAAADATTGKTVIAAQATAAAWDPANNYSPGPAKRVESADAELIPAAWTSRTNTSYFGTLTNISADGSTVVAFASLTSDASLAHIFTQPADGWANATAATGTIRLGASGTASAEGLWGVDVNADGSRVLIEDRDADMTDPTATDAGAVYRFDRPTAGWTGTLARTDNTGVITGPTRQANGHFSAPLYNNAGTLAAFADTDFDGDMTAKPRLFMQPENCTERTANEETTTTCTLPLGNTAVTVPLGTPDGPFTISGMVGVRFGDGTESQNVRAALQANVGTVNELARVSFGFATDTMGDSDASNDRPFPSVVAPGGSTTLRLQLLNENGKASAKGAAASVLFSTARGTLSARLGSASDEACVAGGRQVCRLANSTTALTADNSDQILLTVTHPGVRQAGETLLRVLVVNSAGQTLATDPVTLTFSGPARALAITQPATALLSYAPPAPATGQAADNRNAATLVVSATDTAGNKATVPTSRYSAKLTDPEGKTVSLTGANAKVDVAWPLREGDAADGDLVLSDGNPQARVTVSAAATAPLAAGEYRLELSAGSGAGKLSATQTIELAGGAAAVSLSADPTGAIGQGDSVTLTATVSDADGGPVPDGTPVEFEEQSTGANSVLVMLGQDRQLTRDGQASVTLRAVGIGGAYVTAKADSVSSAQSIRVAAPPPPPPAERVTSTAPEAFSVWEGAGSITAAELFADLEGVSRVRKWFGSDWVSYGVRDGLLTSGSIDFLIERGDVLWLTGE